MLRFITSIKKNALLFLFLKYLALFTILFVTIAMAALLKTISLESNPFFYANF